MKKTIYISIGIGIVLTVFSIIRLNAEAYTSNYSMPKIENYTFSYTFTSADATKCTNAGYQVFAISSWDATITTQTGLATTSTSGTPKTLTYTIPENSTNAEYDIGCAHNDGKATYVSGMWISYVMNKYDAQASGTGYAGMIATKLITLTTPTTTAISNDGQDLFNGILIFFISFSFIILFFKKRN